MIMRLINILKKDDIVDVVLLFLYTSTELQLVV